MFANSLDNEQELLRLMKAGDKSAFTELYRAYSPRLFIKLVQLVKIREIAEEILQEIFVMTWEKREAIDITQTFYGYLKKVAENKAIDFFRKLKRDRVLMAHIGATSSGYYKHVEEDTIINEVATSHLKAVEDLPGQRKQVYHLCKIEGRSYKEVSHLLKISPSTINDHIVKAIRVLRHRILYP